MSTIDKIIKLMESEQMSQAELSRISGARSSSVSDWMKGKSTSYYKYIDKIAEHFGVSTDYLLNDNIDEEKKDVSDYNLEGVYLSLAKEAQEQGISPEDIMLAIETVKRIKGE